MNVLVIGQGAREHALIWKLKQSKKVEKLFCAPGSQAIGQIARNVNLKPENFRGLSDFASRNKIHLTVVGPEKPLVAGLADEFRRRKLKIFGPEKRAAQLEGSKVFAKEFMRRNHIPTAPYRIFTTYAEAVGFCHSVKFPVVIKADGLAAGKGVVIAKSFDEAVHTLDLMLEKKAFGTAGNTVVIEGCLVGEEVSVMAITDGNVILPLISSQDHKRVFDQDKGANTGGMGAFAPTSLLTPEVTEQVHEYIFMPFLAGLKKEAIPYIGVVYAGLMLTEAGPKVLEFNCRFGDPETQVILPLLKTDLVDVFMAAAEKKLEQFAGLEWRQGAAACVVMASKGYPEKFNTGKRITGLPNQPSPTQVVFHAGTKRDNNNWFTAGGRVLSVVGVDATLKGALDRSYDLVRKIRFDGAHYRKDIGAKGLAELERLSRLPKIDKPHIAPAHGLAEESGDLAELDAGNSIDKIQNAADSTRAELNKPGQPDDELPLSSQQL